jgi:hypothetical protein
MKIRPGVEYTREEVAAFRDDPDLADVLLRGYVFTLTIGGNFMMIPWNQAAGGGYTGGGPGPVRDTTDGGKSTYGAPAVGVFDKNDLPSIVRRTPQQRMESLMSKVGDDLRLYLSGQAGHEISGEATRSVTQQTLQLADDKFEEAESGRFARTTGNPHA